MKNKKFKTIEKCKRIFVLLLVLCTLAGCAGSKAAGNQNAGERADDTESVVDDTKREPNIVCWGDSLTYGTGGEGVTYPSVLAEKTGLTVYNYGVRGETAKQIAIRMGLYQMTVLAFTIPEDTTPVSVSLLYQGEDPVMMRLGDVGMNPCEISGVKGELSYQEADGKYYFTRLEAGKEVSVEEDAVVTMDAAGKVDANDIVVLFAGSNDRPTKEDAAALIATEKEMIAYLGSEKYIIVGLTSQEMIPEVAAVNEELKEAFGDHFLDIRSYFLEHGLEDAGITPTEQDKADIVAGEIPSSLRVDIVHGTPDFYQILGEQLYEKMRADGYLPKEE